MPSSGTTGYPPDGISNATEYSLLKKALASYSSSYQIAFALLFLSNHLMLNREMQNSGSAQRVFLLP
jgi:hypothetical protein